jgi:hypothetical protein
VQRTPRARYKGCMPTPLLRRLARWIGCWRGSVLLEDGRAGVLEVIISPHFDGNMLQLDARSWLLESGEIRGQGMSFWAMGRDGRVENAMWSDRLGFSVLAETPDDPEVLAMEGDLSGNLRLSISFGMEDDELLMSTAVMEGYAAARDVPRATSRMQRVGARPPEAQYD